MGKRRSKKSKKHKKDKNKKDSYSSSSSESDSDLEWVEANKHGKDKDSSKGKEESWLTSSGSSNLNDILSEFVKDKKPKEPKERPIDIKAGQHKLELNPYFKDGGVGLPKDQSSHNAADTQWLRKSYYRAVELAKEENISVEEYLSARWDPVNVNKMITLFGNKYDDKPGRSTTKTNRFSRPDDDGDYIGSASRYSDSQPRWSSSRSPKQNTSSSKGSHQRWKKNNPGDSSIKSRQSRSRSRSPSRSSICKSRSPISRANFSSNDHQPRWKKNTPASHSHLKSGVSSSRRSRSRSPSTSNRDSSRLSRNPDKFIDKQSQSSRSDTLSSKPEPVDKEEEVFEEKEVTDDDINKMSAQLLKAELSGNKAKAAKMKANLANMREAKSRGLKIRVKTKAKVAEPAQKSVVLTKTGRSGVEMPVMGSEEQKKGASKLLLHDSSGERTKYFHDDDKYSLKDLIQQEKMTSAADSNRTFASLAGKSGPDVEEGEYRDSFIKPKARLDKEANKEKTYALSDYRKHGKSLDKCSVCIEKVSKHLVISVGSKVYLSLPGVTSLTDYHCLLAPLAHVPSSTALDEDVWNELVEFKRQLFSMFTSLDLDCVFMETVTRLNKYPHMQVECIPMPRDCGDMIMIYFKKAILESGSEWAQNKKLVELKAGDIRRSVPKGFPYFCVEFGMDGGFAHVIDDEVTFAPYFGKEILGGVLDKGPNCWRNPKKEAFENQSKKVLKFESVWKEFDKWRAEDSD